MEVRSRRVEATSGRWIGPAGLWMFAVGALVVGVVVPLVSIAIKTASSDSFLARISWHSARTSLGGITYYWRYAIANSLLLIAVVVFRPRLLGLFERLIAWSEQPTERFARRTISLAVVGMAVCFVTKVQPGFWYHGIAGWDYSTLSSQLTATPPDDMVDAATLSADVRSALERSIVWDNARHVGGSGYLTNTALLLHFASGEIQPANWELLDMVFPNVAFRLDRPEDREPFFEIVRHNLDARRDGRRHWLPRSWSYPNHTHYMAVDYRSCPPADSLSAISSWRITLRVDDRAARLVGVRQECRIDAP